MSQSPPSSVRHPVCRPATVVRRRGRALLVALLLVGLVLLVRTTVAVPVRVASASMEPSYSAGDVVLVSHIAPKVTELQRGDLVLFRSDDGRTLKRVVGLPGESVVILDGALHVNGARIPEPYVDHAMIDGYYSRTFEVPEGSVFVMGDNRGNSVDSRDYGAIHEDQLLGRVLLTIWPLGS